MSGEIGLTREVLAGETVRVLVRASLPRTLRIAEVDLHIGRDAEGLVLGELGPSVPRQRSAQLHRERAHLLQERSNNGDRVLASTLTSFVNRLWRSTRVAM